jgi:hypothetical protein
MSDAKYRKFNPGSKRPSDVYLIPLCGRHHREQHSMSEYEFWSGLGVDPIKIALKLFDCSGDAEEGERIILAEAELT